MNTTNKVVGIKPPIVTAKNLAATFVTCQPTSQEMSRPVASFLGGQGRCEEGEICYLLAETGVGGGVNHTNLRDLWHELVSADYLDDFFCSESVLPLISWGVLREPVSQYIQDWTAEQARIQKERSEAEDGIVLTT